MELISFLSFNILLLNLILNLIFVHKQATCTPIARSHPWILLKLRSKIFYILLSIVGSSEKRTPIMRYLNRNNETYLSQNGSGEVVRGKIIYFACRLRERRIAFTKFRRRKTSENTASLRKHNTTIQHLFTVEQFV